MCSLMIKKDYNKEMQLQQSFYVGYVEYARNISKLSQFYINLIIRYINILNRVLKYIYNTTYFELRY